MERVMKKLNSRRGASILLAMALILTALMISAVIVSAALTAAHRVSHDSKEEQKTLALNSAAKAMKDYLETAGEYEYYDEDSANESLYASTERNVTSISGIMEHFESKLPDSIGDPVSFELTAAVDTADLPADMADAFQKSTTMALTVQSSNTSSPIEGTTVTDYPFTGTAHCVDDDAAVLQKLYVTGTVKKTVVVTEETEYVTVTVNVPNPAHETDPTAPETVPEDTEEPVTVTITTTTWSMAGIRLTSKES